MASLHEENAHWKKHLNILNILLPPKEFCDAIKPKLDNVFTRLESRNEYTVCRFGTLEKNTIVSILYDFIFKGLVKPEIVEDDDEMLNVVLHILTLSGFRDFQISFAIVHYMSYTTNLTYEKDKKDIKRIREFTTTYPHITYHDTEKFVNYEFSRYYIEITNNTFMALENGNTYRAIKLCSYTEERLAEEMDDYISEILEDGLKSDNPVVKEKETIKPKEEIKMKKLSNVSVSMLTGDLVVKTRAGKYVSFNKETGNIQEYMGELVVDATDFISVIPCVKVAVGDTIVRNGRLLYIKSINEEETGEIIAIDAEQGTEDKILKVDNQFGITYYKKVINISQLGQVQPKISAAEAQQLMTLLFVEDDDITEMGKMLILSQLQNVEAATEGEEVPKMDMNAMMMMSMMKSKDGSNNDPMKMMMAMQMAGGTNKGAMNPLMMMAMMKDKSGESDNSMMKMMMAMQMAGGTNAGGINPLVMMNLMK